VKSSDIASDGPWDVILTESAEADFQAILQWTMEQFGEAQVRAYSETLSAAIEALVEGPQLVGARPRDDIAKGIHVLHVARNGRHGRHFLIFQASSSSLRRRIDVLRVLHDAMDLSRHLRPADGR